MTEKDLGQIIPDILATATVDNKVGEPAVNVTVEQINEVNRLERKFNFKFVNMKGEKGDTPVKGVDYLTEEEKQQFTTETLSLVTAEGAKQVKLVTDKGSEEVGKVTSEGSKQTELVNIEGNKVVEQVKSIVAGNPATTNALTLSGKTRVEFEQDIQAVSDRLSQLDGHEKPLEYVHGFFSISENKLVFRSDSSKRNIALKEGMSVHLAIGDTIEISDWVNVALAKVFWNEGGTYKEEGVWNKVFTAKADSYHTFHIQTNSENAVIEDFSKLVKINSSYKTVNINKKIEDLKIADVKLNEEIKLLKEKDIAIENETKFINRKGKYLLKNICSENYVINQSLKGFIADNCAVIQDNEWFKLTPNLGRSYCSFYYYSPSFGLKKGKYLITYTMKVDNTSGILKTSSGRITGKAEGGKNVFDVPKVNSTYTARKTQTVVITKGEEWDSLCIYFAFNKAITEENKIDIYIKDISMVNIDEIYEPFFGYSIANAIDGQLNGFVDGTQIIDIALANTYPIWNHNIVLLGDSIFDLCTSGKKLAVKTKANVFNGAKGGETAVYGQISPTWKTESVFSLYKISESIKTGNWSEQIAQNPNKGNLLNSIDFNSIDYLFILIGTNDWRRNPKIGTDDSTDLTTFKGAMNVILDNILSTYPNINVVLLSPLYRAEFGDSDTVPNENGTYLYEVANAMGDIAKKYHLPFFNLYYEGGINKYNHQIYLSDKTHPTTAFDEKLASIMYSIIKDKCIRSFGRETE